MLVVATGAGSPTYLVVHWLRAHRPARLIGSVPCRLPRGGLGRWRGGRGVPVRPRLRAPVHRGPVPRTGEGRASGAGEGPSAPPRRAGKARDPGPAWLQEP